MPRRPSAFEVSFPDEAPLVSQEKKEPVASSSNSRKRQNHDYEPNDRPVKQRQLPPVAYYVPRADEEQSRERADLIIPGEDLEDLGEEDRPIRMLTDFAIFDPLHKNEMISLSAIEEEDGVDRHFEGSGMVSPYFLDEDGVEEEGTDDDQDNQVYVRLGAIVRFFVDYTKEDFWIETQYAWYILQKPVRTYQEVYQVFYTPRKVTQLVIAAALRRPECTYEQFLPRYLKMVDIFGRTCKEYDLRDAAMELKNVIEETNEFAKLKSVPLVKQILRTVPGISRPPRAYSARSYQLPLNLSRLKSRNDLEVLKPEHQNPTHVTPFIARLVEGYVSEDLHVVGAKPPAQDKSRIEEQRRQVSKQLRLLVRTARQKRDWDWNKDDRYTPRSDFVRSITIDGQRYNVGDYIITGGDNPPSKLPTDEHHLPPDAKIADYFWFARIINFVPSPVRGERARAHVQWLEHGTQIYLKEVAHPQELFLNDLCDDISLESIAGKVVVHERPQNIPTNQTEYFYKFKHDKETAAFLSIDLEHSQRVTTVIPPDNCPVCLLSEERSQSTEARRLGAGDGFAFGGHTFHMYDFVLFKAIQGPASIGYIRKVGSDNVKVKQVGRIGSLGNILPENFCRDERHLYLTDEDQTVSVTDLIQVIHVLHVGGHQRGDLDLEGWLDESPSHFYIKYYFSSMKPESWYDRDRIDPDRLKHCTICHTEMLEKHRLLRKFSSYVGRRPMAVLDLFGGVGAFSLGMKEGFPALNVSHTIEISPSAAKTFSHNVPGAVVYNQCANAMLKYAIKKQEGHQTDPPKQLRDGTPVPDPPKKGTIQVIIAGFPCQSHSALNMFKVANDPKNNLVFNALSYMDVYRPQFGYFENVPGFLNSALNATQVTRHRLEGGIKMGGLKLLVRGLVDLGYQVRFSLLQAVHYGTPQNRVRFFLIAALDGSPLPDLPQPTHDSPVNKSLVINFPNGTDSIRPIKTDNGTALHRSITIDDAIDDLPRFDWKHPRPQSLTSEKQRELRRREQSIPTFTCCVSKEAGHCGYQGPNVEYHQNPQTRYQAVARRRRTRDLQHYTKRLTDKKVERVVSIPLEPGADYRSLEPHLTEWQLSNPMSHVARSNYRPGRYGRLDGKSFFPTTVTNVDPTAKQSRVLHPYCRRIVSVRELARSQGFPDDFVFKAYDDSVVTMHRQIGNSVPLPVAAALGRQLREALFQHWLEQRRRGQTEVMVIDDDDDE